MSDEVLIPEVITDPEVKARGERLVTLSMILSALSMIVGFIIMATCSAALGLVVMILILAGSCLYFTFVN